MQLHMFPLDPELVRLQLERAKLQTAVLSKNTLISYGYDWAMFTAWCLTMGRAALPASPETVALYLTAILSEGLKVVTASRRGCAIAHHHRGSGLLSPITTEIHELLLGAQRSRCEQPRQMRPLSVAQLREISKALAAKGTNAAIRDRAVLVMGFASALRRSSLAALMIEDIEFTARGFIIQVRREKNDQQGRGRLIGVPPGKRAATCPVRCLRAWLKIRGRRPGPLFFRLDGNSKGKAMDGEGVERIVKRGVKLIGLDPRDRWSAHSLRSGFVTAAGEAGIGDLLIAAQTGHQNMAVLRKYFRRTELFRSNPCALLGL